jgi:hypothetical protein
MRSLTANRHTPPVPKPAITAEIHKPLDVHGDLSSQIPFDLVVAVNYAANSVDLFFGEKICLGIAVHVGLVQNLL